MNIFKWLLTKRIKSLDPGKIYVIQLNVSPESDLMTLTKWAADIKEKYNIDIIFIVKDMSFVELPEGYTIEKRKNNQKNPSISQKRTF